MKSWTTTVYDFYLKVINSIAFYPTLITIAFMGFSVVVMSIEYAEIILDLKEHLKSFLVHAEDNARLILGTIVGSVISLMVFSFSMVMVVLNSATATLSPRVLPGLISNKFHQTVLGFYLGTIIFSLILIININSATSEYKVPSLGILVSMLLVIVCLGLFVYFIHSISQKIQVDNILNGIYKNTKKELKEADTDRSDGELPNTKNWYDLNAGYSGYLKRINKEGLLNFCNEHEVKIKVKVPLGSFVGKYHPFVMTSKKLDEDKAADIMSFFILYPEERIADYYTFGFKQISEIAVKALSPGINDPGTALKAIDLLSDLFIEVMQMKEEVCITNKDEEVTVILTPTSFEDLLYRILVPIRSYGKEDILILLRLLDCLEHMLYACDDNFRDILKRFINNMIVCSQEYISNELDKERINEKLKCINSHFNDSSPVELLS
ncbi:DUF2254 domain-containing protein [Fulvivirga sp. RKSG066]|uniref:DUF2254 domain-containing protein n=1 Tax=Fulvivirga aurantia TaxID=2529383 RepID=UPI0012BB4D6B|nr:DUF2254 domain-containing protein [Fulvivirga aurantia]MTI20815.1 DUF2254 domain-containing protein [Fulvivirga aurantia]